MYYLIHPPQLQNKIVKTLLITLSLIISTNRTNISRLKIFILKSFAIYISFQHLAEYFDPLAKTFLHQLGSPTLNHPLPHSTVSPVSFLPLETMKLPIAFAIPRVRGILHTETPFPSPFPTVIPPPLPLPRLVSIRAYPTLENGSLLNPFTFL